MWPSDESIVYSAWPLTCAKLTLPTVMRLLFIAVAAWASPALGLTSWNDAMHPIAWWLGHVRSDITWGGSSPECTSSNFAWQTLDLSSSGDRKESKAVCASFKNLSSQITREKKQHCKPTQETLHPYWFTFKHIYNWKDLGRLTWFNRFTLGSESESGSVALPHWL